MRRRLPARLSAPCFNRYTCGGQRFICALVRDRCSSKLLIPNPKPVLNILNTRPCRRVLHDACPTTASLHRLFSENNVDGGLCLVSDSPQVMRLLNRLLKHLLLNFSSGLGRFAMQSVGRGGRGGVAAEHVRLHRRDGIFVRRQRFNA